MSVQWRRIAVAALLGFATFGGIVVALDPADPQAVSGPAIAVPFPNVGDRGTYAWDLVESSAPAPRLDFEWVGPHRFPGAQGPQTAQGVQADGVEQYLAHPDNDFRSLQRLTSVYSFDDAGMVGQEHWTFDNETEPTSAGEPAIDIDQNMPVEQGMQSHRRYGVAGAHCLFRSPLQGGLVTPSAAAWAQAPCVLGGSGSFDGRTMAWTWVGVEEVGGVAAVRLHGEGPREASRDRVHAVDVWLAGGVPYPLRVTWDGITPGRLDLASFEAGTGPAAVTATYAPILDPPALPLVVAPRTAAFLDDSGIEHPLTVSEALAMAASDPRADTFRQYLADEPSAYIYWAEDTGNGDASGWSLHFRGERDSFHLSVWKGPSKVPFTPTVPRLGLEYPEILVGQSRRPADPGTVPPSQLPTDLPTVASLLAAWQVASQEGAVQPEGTRITPTWGFAYVCSDLDQLDLDTYYPMLGAAFRDPCVPSLYTWAGQRAESEAWQPGGAAGQALYPWSISWLVTQDSVARYTIEGLYSHQTQPTSPLNVTFAAPSAGGGVVGGGDGPSFLTPPAAASAGAAAFLVAVAYWFWPSLKSGGAALFSRIQGNDVLQHPKRELLLDVIRGSPGIRFRSLARQTGLPNGALIHHLRKLEDSEMIRTIRMKRYLAYVAKGMPTPVESHPALESESARRLLGLIDATPGINLRDAARSAGLSPATTHYHLRRLTDAKFVRIEKHGRANRLLPGQLRLQAQPGTHGPGISPVHGAHGPGPDQDSGVTSPAGS